MRLVLLLSLACAAWASAAEKGARDFLKKPDAWYASAEAKQTGVIILSYQADSGGWPKNTDTVTKPYTGKRASLQATFDNGATLDELRFLARMFNATKEEAYRQAFDKGLEREVRRPARRGHERRADRRVEVVGPAGGRRLRGSPSRKPPGPAGDVGPQGAGRCRASPRNQAHPRERRPGLDGPRGDADRAGRGGPPRRGVRERDEEGAAVRVLALGADDADRGVLEEFFKLSGRQRARRAVQPGAQGRDQGLLAVADDPAGLYWRGVCWRGGHSGGTGVERGAGQDGCVGEEVSE